MKHFKTLALAAAMALGCAQANASAFANGGFEETDVNDWGLSIPTSVWSLSVTNLSDITVGTGINGSVPEGIQALQFASLQPSSIAQTFDLLANTQYKLSFSVATDDTVADSFIVKWNGAVLDTLTLTSANYGSWVERNYIFNTTAAVSNTLSFTGEAKGNGYAYLDNVSISAVAAVPEPSTYAMLLAGLGMMGVVARRRRSA